MVELRRTCPISSTKVEEAEPVRTGTVMVEGMVGGSNGGKKGERGVVEGRDEETEKQRMSMPTTSAFY